LQGFQQGKDLTKKTLGVMGLYHSLAGLLSPGEFKSFAPWHIQTDALPPMLTGMEKMYQALQTNPLIPMEEPFLAPSLVSLSFLQRRMFDLMVRGKTRKEIADRLGYNIHYVKLRWQHIYDKLGIHDAAVLMRFAIEHDFVE
jgi:DNA-binding CsgD family transcriptional regulator